MNGQRLLNHKKTNEYVDKSPKNSLFERNCKIMSNSIGTVMELDDRAAALGRALYSVL